MTGRLLLSVLAAAVCGCPAADVEAGRPRYAVDGRLLRPERVDRWVVVGASLGQGYTDATEDGPGMFHRVSLEPSAYEHFLDTGRFPEGTMLALTIRRPERRVPPSRTGFTEGELVALELAVKDGSRFQGGWAYFDFGRDRDTATAIPHEHCAACHARHAALDNVFVQFYPQLRSR
ncbi:MAG TPA: cytochrome P460 family protein [Gemmatimonadales bacterium]|nr:cytochrome P460 family protein [Gemmatimonadales bacterium]